LTPARARAWGAALARLHRDGTGADVAIGPGAEVGPGGAEVGGLPQWFVELDRAQELFGPDTRLVQAVTEVAAQLRALPRDGDGYGVVHGDFELDNMAWVGDRSVAFDFDDAGRSWFAADITQAVRDLQPFPAAGAAAGQSGDFAGFLAGYRQVRPLPEVDLTLLPLFTAAHSASWLTRLPAVLDTGPSATSPTWLTRLHAKLTDHGRRLRDLVLAHADSTSR
jgi:Ser/Thr protein kinase RdoA (MazF antagonist)